MTACLQITEEQSNAASGSQRRMSVLVEQRHLACCQNKGFAWNVGGIKGLSVSQRVNGIKVLQHTMHC